MRGKKPNVCVSIVTVRMRKLVALFAAASRYVIFVIDGACVLSRLSSSSASSSATALGVHPTMDITSSLPRARETGYIRMHLEQQPASVSLSLTSILFEGPPTLEVPLPVE
jgi:hypothetical protein